MSNLQILSNSIRIFENLYSLNDLHLASGAEKKHQPALFIRLDATQDLIAEIQKEISNTDLILKSINGGRNRGTYACKEIVIAYAAWISPQFHLVVLRAFLEKLNNTGTISPEQQQAIQSAVQQTHHRTGLSYQEIYQRIKAKFKVAKYDQLKPEQMRDALLFIASMQPDFLTQPKQTINVDWFNMMNFALLLKQYHRFTKDLPHIHAYLSALPEHSAMAGLLKNHLTEMKNNDRLFTDSILSLSEISNHFLPQDQWKSLMRIFSEMIVE